MYCYGYCLTAVIQAGRGVDFDNSAYLDGVRILCGKSNELLDGQLEKYLESIDMESVDRPVSKGKRYLEASSTAKDRVANIQLSSADMPFLGNCRPMRHSLRDLIQTNILFSNLDRKKDSKKRDHKKSKSSSHAGGGGKEISRSESKITYSLKNDNISDDASTMSGNVDALTVLVVKAISEGSLGSLLFAVFALLEYESSFNSASAMYLPVGHIIASMFSSPHDKARQNSLLSADCQILCSPFQPFLARYHPSEDAPATVADDLSAANALAYTGAGEQRGRFLVNSASEDDFILEEMDEEEMLAQALALSMELSNGIDSATPTPAAGTDENDKMDVESDAGNEDDAVVDLSPTEADVRYTCKFSVDRPTGYDAVHPFCTIGPTSHRLFWESFHYEDPKILENNMISVRNVCIALFMALGMVADKQLNEQSVVVDDSASPAGIFTLATPMWPCPNHLNLALLDHILGLLLEDEQSPSAGRKDFGYRNSYISIWQIRILFQLMRALFHTAIQSDEKLYHIGLELNISFHMLDRKQAKGTVPLVISLLLSVHKAMGKESLQSAMVDVEGWLPLFPVYRTRYDLRVLATKTFATGFPIFVPIAADRDCVLQRLLLEVVDGRGLEKYCQNSCFMEATDPLVSDTISSDELHKFLLLQNLCTCPAVLEYPSRYFVTQFDTAPYDDGGCTLFFSKLLGFSSKSTNTPVERLLLDRVGYLSMDKKRPFRPSECCSGAIAAWGELRLLRAIQLEYIKVFNVAVVDAGGSAAQPLSFSSLNCSKHLTLSLANTSVTVKPTIKGWATACMDGIGFSPDTGTFEWDITIEKCDRGDLYVGLLSRRSHLSSFIGSDLFGWGLMGSRSLSNKYTKSSNAHVFNFRTGDVVHIKIDTNTRIMYARINHSVDWRPVFESLPSTLLIPAVSLRNINDSVSISPAARVPANSASDAFICRGTDPETGLTESVYRRGSTAHYLSIFIAHFQYCLSIADPLIMELQEPNQYPLFSLCLPSLAAAVGVILPDANLGVALAMQLLPFLSVLTKKLCVRINHSTSESKTSEVFFTDLVGTWSISCSPAASSVPSQVYVIVIDTQGVLDDSQSVTTFKGRGETSSFGLSVSGVRNDLSVSFVERWILGSKCSFEGKVSLCGCFMAGTYCEDKTGKTGDFTARRTALVRGQSDESSRGAMLKTAVLFALAIGKLSGFLISGPGSFRENMYAVENLSVRVDGREQDDIVGDEDVESVHSDKPLVAKRLVDDEVKKWCLSELFSNGTPLKGQLQQCILDEIKSRTRFDLQDSSSEGVLDVSTADAIYGTHTYSGVIRYWTAKTFAFVSETLIDNIPELPPSADDQDGNCSQFPDRFALGSEETSRFDEWMQTQTSPFVFARVGGPSVISLRRVVIAAMIKHTGCSRACNDVMEARKGNVSSNTRCLNLLKEIWFSAQRIIQEIIRQRQETGTSVAVICKAIREKAEYMLTLEASPSAIEISELLTMSVGEKELAMSPGSASTEIECADDSVSKDATAELFTRCLTEILKFLQCPVPNIVPLLRCELRRSAVVSVFRIGGFRALMFMMQAMDDAPFLMGSSMPPLSVLSVQPFLLCSVLGAMLKKCCQAPFSDDHRSPKTSKSGEMEAKHVNRDNGIIMSGHYTVGLYGVATHLKQSLIASFESLYEFITQLASRCTWAKNVTGQNLTLSCWNIRISLRDHMFLNRVGIFKVLRNVLEEARAVLSDQEAPNYSDSTDDHQQLSFFKLRQSCSTLSQLALRIVHSLSSQVAFSMDPRAKTVRSNQLQRHASGPDTLSQSLFDLLYSELFFGLKDVAQSLPWVPKQADDGGIPRPLMSGHNNEVNSILYLKGEDYIYRILRLLYSISVSRVCQKSLSAPKWITLLLLSIGCGGLGTQRRVFRLLRRLLISVVPESIDIYVPSFFGLKAEITQSAEPFTDKDVRSLASNFSIPDRDSSTIKCSTSGESIVELLLYGVAVAYPVCNDTAIDAPQGKLIKYLLDQDSLFTISSESLTLLRVLQGIPAWRRSIDSVMKKFYVGRTSRADQSICYDTLLSIGAGCLYGGYIERNRIGGFICLNPSSAGGGGDSRSNQKNGVNSGDGLIVGMNKATEEVEMVFVERHLKTWDASIFPNDPLLGDARNVQHICTVTATVPIVAIRVHMTKVIPSSEVPPQSELIGHCTFVYVLKSMEEALARVSDKKEDEVIPPSDLLSHTKPVVGQLLNVVSMCQFANAVHYAPLVHQFLENKEENKFQTNLLRMFAVAMGDSASGGLNDLEVVQQRWTTLWDSMVANTFGSDVVGKASAQPATAKVLGMNVSRRQQPSNNNDRLAPEQRERESRTSTSYGALAEQLAMHRQMTAAPPPQRQPDPAAFAAAVAQMQEMGLPKDWCEVALRRCRNNIEMAINMCFENGAEMSQIVAEEVCRLCIVYGKLMMFSL
jgi:hypothetical protein